ncbi:Peptidoglycan/LPS O-acetylase OafA/YrhL, contains acyltransferase and SGNH-hydrolase domains [Modicisalibacter muralis]|uniref:Peptidoglycan/LPS O-acetylase OafA/YrhL, contains acyltransferase and SGNH-hydrolase domains n=1 Tax=Modicisalibacter muralis TaxID=119000 RepID=A0A1G9GJC5_9GAMM|nr:acyltransferase [Halomonas muralis]SDL00393.1 Peptidoglycan/LPS O-acetylase OafA/YrhL, contains acyltransferase and SGNH-hydrolase domains [Halomonas muralis]
MENKRTTVKKERFIGLEWLRFLLGLYIVIFHTLHTYSSISDWSGYITDIGFFSTSAFFVLSGFLLAHVYLDDDKRMREPAKSFWVKRFSNLYPIHIGAMLLAMAVSTLVGYLAITPGDAGASIRFVLYDVNDGSTLESITHYMSDAELALNVLLNVTLLHAWNPLYLTFNPVTWSISALFFFYLTFPWIAPRLSRVTSQRRALVVTNLIYLIPPLVVIAMTDFAMPETGILHRNPLVRLPEFMAGILLCALYTQRRQMGLHLGVGVRWALLLFIALSVIIGSWLLRHQGPAWYYLLHNGLLLPAQLALIFVVAHWSPPSSSRMRRLATRLGGASLPMFALHVPLFVVFTRVERVLKGEPSLCLSSIPRCMEAAGDASIWLYPVFLLFTVLFCMMFQENFVVRIRQWLQGKLLSSGRQAVHANSGI